MSTIVWRTGRIATLVAFVSLTCAPFGCGEDTTSGGASDPDDELRTDAPPEDPPTTDRFDDFDRHDGSPPPLAPAPVYDIDGDDDGATTPLDPTPPPELDGDDLETIDHEYPAGQVDDIIEGTDNSSEGSSDDGSDSSDDDGKSDGSGDDGSSGSESNGGDDTSGHSEDVCVSGDDTINPMLPTAPGSYGCTRTRGYWSTHHQGATNSGLRRDWPTPYDEDQEMCDRTLVSIVGKQLLTDHVRTIPSADRQEAERLKNLLDDYNNGIVGPGKCP